MKIKVGKYELVVERWCMWITEQAKSKKTGRMKYNRITGYYETWDQLKAAFARVRMSEDKETMTELIDVLRQTEKDLAMLNEAALENDFTDLEAIAKKLGE